jgi:hypothetical protein
MRARNLTPSDSKERKYSIKEGMFSGFTRRTTYNIKEPHAKMKMYKERRENAISEVVDGSLSLGFILILISTLWLKLYLS